ncbi:unnamed protein product, partial [Arabidopsis halleri]
CWYIYRHYATVCAALSLLVEKKTVVALTLQLILYTSVITLRKLDCNPLDFFIQHMTAPHASSWILAKFKFSLFHSWSCGHLPVPSNVHPGDVASNIRMAIQLYPMISDAAMVMFSAYRDFNPLVRSEKVVKEPVKIVFVRIERPFNVIYQSTISYQQLQRI